MPTKRTSLAAGESLKLKVIVLSDQPPRTAEVFYKKLGTRAFAKASLRHQARGVYQLELPWPGTDDLEYWRITCQDFFGRLFLIFWGEMYSELPACRQAG